MSYKVIPTDVFLKDLKALQKKYRCVVDDIDELVKELEQNPVAGIALGQHLFKIRLKSSDRQSGKRGGFRVIYYFAYRENIYLVKIYSKNIDDNFVRTELAQIVKSLSMDV